MRDFDALEAALAHPIATIAPQDAAVFFLHIGEEAIENWLHGQNRTPTDKLKEGFRILALHAQGAKGEPSFHACRETARELVYHYNLLQHDPTSDQCAQHLKTMQLLARHLVFFIGGKMQEANLGEFCCAAKPIRVNSN